jgi:DNA repair exonuclease SbcCD ATPase subunit
VKVFQLVLNNFGSFFGCHAIPMSDLGLVFVRGQNLDEPRSPSNGAGKSTIFDALDWCLFGEVPRGDVAKSIINEEAKKDCWVIAQLEDQGERYTVFRYRLFQKESGLKFWARSLDGSGSPWQNLTTLDEAQTQERVNEALGLDRRIFRAAVYRAQGDDFVFADATDGERKETLTALIPELADVDTVKDRAKALLMDVQKSKFKEQGTLQQILNELAALDAVDWSSAQASWEAQRAQRYGEAQGQQDSAAKALHDAQMHVAMKPALEMELVRLQAEAFTPITAWQVEYDRRLLGRSSAASRVASLQAQYKGLSAELLPFQKGQVKEGPCPCCKQMVSAEHIQHEIARLQALLAPLVTDGKQARAELEHIEASIQEAAGFRSQEIAANQAGTATHAQKVGSIKSQIAGLVQVEKGLVQLDGNVRGWAFHMMGIQNEIWPGDAQKAVAMQRGADLDQAQFHVQEEIGRFERKEKLLMFWIDALTAKGLKNLIMDSRIEEMSTAANAWVQALTGGTTWVRFETQTLTQAGKLSEKMNIRIFRHNPGGTVTERNFKSWSGGERTRVALGVDQGLVRLVADRATKAWDLFILDESFSRGLDGGGREAVFEQIQKLKGGTVFVVDHTDIGAYFEKSLIVRCQNRRSQVFMGEVTCQQPSSDPLSYLPPASSASTSA